MNKYIKTGSFTGRELQIILDECKLFMDLSFPGRIGFDSKKINEQIRKGNVYFPRMENHIKLINILQSKLIEVYSGSSINLSTVSNLQYVCYQEGEFYNWHRDTYLNKKAKIMNRGITMSVNLTPEEEYEGGELQVKVDDKSSEFVEMNKKIGSFMAFPSFLVHKAYPVTKGVREAIVVWTDNSSDEIFKLSNDYYKYVDGKN